MRPDGRRTQIAIAGFGAAGAALALALRQAGFEGRDITLFDGAPAQVAKKPDLLHKDVRQVALNAGSKTLLETLRIWPHLTSEAHPMRRITLTDSALEADIRPLLLEFVDSSASPLAYLLPLSKLTAALRAACQAADILVVPQKIDRFDGSGARMRIEAGGEALTCELLVGADGAASPIRQKAGIALHGWPYGQVAIVATIRHSLDHGGEAVQHFLPSGPFALLPLDAHRSSIVWSEARAHANALLAADAATQFAAIAQRMAGWRGELMAVEAISSHPLALGLARNFIAPRLALVGDAAHQVHPLAGQGLNLGFADIAELAERIVDAARLGLDIGAPDVLAAYQSRRRPAAVALGLATESLNRLFSQAPATLRRARDAASGLIGRSDRAKAAMMRIASGRDGLAPRLCRGESL